MSDWQHIEINNHGTIVVLSPISDEGRQWFEDNVGEPEPGGIYTCEPRMAQAILQAGSTPDLGEIASFYFFFGPRHLAQPGLSQFTRPVSDFSLLWSALALRSGLFSAGMPVFFGW